MSTSPRFRDHFTGVAADYAQHRPTYPGELLEKLVELSPDTRHALDVGCGNGQLSLLLAEHFDRVIATDASAAQIAAAMPHPRIIYRVRPAEDSGLEDGSVSLVTVAQAAHWFDLAPFYREVRRVGAPDALIALISYGRMRIDGPANPAVQHFYGPELAAYWPAERAHVENGYADLDFPFSELRQPAFEITREWDAGQFLAYTDTWSATTAMRTALGDAEVRRRQQPLREAWEGIHKVRWPITLRVGKIHPG